MKRERFRKVAARKEAMKAAVRREFWRIVLAVVAVVGIVVGLALLGQRAEGCDHRWQWRDPAGRAIQWSAPSGIV